MTTLALTPWQLRCHQQAAEQRRREALAVIDVLRAVGIRISFDAALDALDTPDPASGRTRCVLFHGLHTLTNGTIHLVRPGDETPLCGAHVRGERDDPDGLDASEFWRLCSRCYRSAALAGLLSGGI